MFTGESPRRIAKALIRKLFPTLLYEAEVDEDLLPDLARSIRVFATEDEAGRRWSREHRYSGYTSYGALLETSGLPLTDVLGTLCELCARGVVALDRSRRLTR